MFPLSDFRSSKVKNRIMHEKSVFTAKIVVKTLFLVSYVRKYKLKKIVCRNGKKWLFFFFFMLRCVKFTFCHKKGYRV